jgi:hypothetical protein
MWITVDNVTDFTGLKPQHLKLDKTDTTKLNEIVEDWILQSEDLIKSYTQGSGLFVCGSRRMQIYVTLTQDELDSFGSGGGL